MAGYWAGILGAVVAMVMAALGILLADFGQAVAMQFTPDHFAPWGIAVRPETMALAGRVTGAFVIYGLIGALVSALIGAIGGMLYPRLRRSS